MPFSSEVWFPLRILHAFCCQDCQKFFYRNFISVFVKFCFKFTHKFSPMYFLYEYNMEISHIVKRILISVSNIQAVRLRWLLCKYLPCSCFFFASSSAIYWSIRQFLICLVIFCIWYPFNNFGWLDTEIFADFVYNIRIHWFVFENLAGIF